MNYVEYSALVKAKPARDAADAQGFFGLSKQTQDRKNICL